MAEGFECFGVDLYPMASYPGTHLIGDILSFDPAPFYGLVDLVVASPPCDEFSRRSMPWFKNAPEPDLGLVNACYRIARALRVPIVLENVRGAVPYLGQPVLRSGPFYLWGDGVPPIVPVCNPRKNAIGPRADRPALRALIPIELARAVGRFHRNRLQL